MRDTRHVLVHCFVFTLENLFEALDFFIENLVIHNTIVRKPTKVTGRTGRGQFSWSVTGCVPLTKLQLI